MRALLILFLGFVLSACGEQSAESKAELNQISFIRVAKENIKSRLTDPGSAEFSDVYFNRTKKDQIDVVCGKVNSKNRLGGYAGNQHFIAFATMQILESDFKNAHEFTEAWSTYCLK